MSTTITIADIAINDTYEAVTGTTSGSGTGATFDVTKTDGVYSVELAEEGTGYVPGDTITVAGADLGGGTANDLIITVATAGVDGVIATFGSVGTGQIGDGVIDILVDVAGTDDVDTYTFNGDSTDFTLSYDEDEGIVATSGLVANLSFNLADHERVVFDDTAIAYDVEGDAGIAYTLLSAALGEADVTDEVMGIALAALDGGATVTEVAQAILDSEIYQEDAGGVSNETFVRQVFTNAVGVAPSLTDLAYFVDVIEDSGVSQAELLAQALDYEPFVDTIDLAGVVTAGTGLTYTPYVETV